MTPLGVVLVFVLALTCLGLGEGIRRLLASRSRSVEDSMLALVVGWVLLSWWGVLLAESGEFRPLVFVGPPMTLLAAVWWARPSSGPGSYRAEPVVVLALGLTVAIGIAAFFPAFDVQLEARDPGTYFHTGRSLADRGSLTWNDDTVLRLSPSTRLELFPQAGSDRAYDSSRYLGFYLEDRDSGRVVPQASPVYPVWVAVGHWIAGATGGRAVASILMLIGGCLLSLLGAAFAGRIGLAAGPLFVAGVVPGWFARFSAAESAAVVAVCAGSLGLLRYRQKGRRVDALVAGLCFGLCPLAKAELLVVLFPLAALFFLDIVTRRFTVRDLIFLWLPISALSAHQLLHATGWLWPYYSDLLLQYGLTAPVFLGGAAGATLAGILTAMAVRRLLRSNAEQLRAFLAGETVSGRMARWMAAIGVLALTAAGYWWRPYQYVVDRGTDSWNMANHVELGLSISPWFVFLAAVGAALVITNRHDRRGIEAAAFLLIVLAALILYERNIIPRPMWSLRRYVPIVIPVHYVLALLAVGWTARRLAAWRVPVALTSALLIAPAVWHHATVGADVKRHVELSGATEAARGLAELFGPEDVVLFEARTRRGLERFEAALGLVNGPTIYRLPGPTIDSDLLSTIARERSRVDGDTYLVTTGYFDGLGDLGAEALRCSSGTPARSRNSTCTTKLTRAAASDCPQRRFPCVSERASTVCYRGRGSRSFRSARPTESLWASSTWGYGTSRT